VNGGVYYSTIIIPGNIWGDVKRSCISQSLCPSVVRLLVSVLLSLIGRPIAQKQCIVVTLIGSPMMEVEPCTGQSAVYGHHWPKRPRPEKHALSLCQKPSEIWAVFKMNVNKKSYAACLSFAVVLGIHSAFPIAPIRLLQFSVKEHWVCMSNFITANITFSTIIPSSENEADRFKIFSI